MQLITNHCMINLALIPLLKNLGEHHMHSKKIKQNRFSKIIISDLRAIIRSKKLAKLKTA